MVSRRLQAIRSLYLQSTGQFAKPITKFVSLVAAKLSPLTLIGLAIRKPAKKVSADRSESRTWMLSRSFPPPYTVPS